MDTVLDSRVKAVADSLFEKWCQENNERSLGLPIRGRLYGALVVLEQLESRSWRYDDLSEAISTDSKPFFADRSISGHTKASVERILRSHGFENLILAGQGEYGRTSTGSKPAGLQLIKLITSALSQVPPEVDREAQGDALVSYLYGRVFALLTSYQQLGGIEVHFYSSESITAFVSRLLDAHSTNPGAVLQHLVGAKLELRYTDSPLMIKHNSSAAADVQTGRLGDFDIGTTVFHVTKSANTGHYGKAWSNAESGRTVYLLVPNNILAGTQQFAEAHKAGFTKKVNVFSIEQFVAQNLDEVARFDHAGALQQLRRLLEKYNELVGHYENDTSLKIIIPDFGV